MFMSRKTKKCTKCKIELDILCFSPSGGGKYKRPECKKCAYKLAKIRKKIRSESGEPPQDYQCPICHKNEHCLIGTGGRAGIWAADHNDETDKFRGHLCHNCNRAIGNFNHDKERLWRAIEYLMKDEENNGGNNE